MESIPQAIWCMDSGATHHMTPHKDFLEDYEEITSFPLYVANKQQLMALEKGKIAFNTVLKGEILPATLTEVLYVPGVVRNLFSTLEAAKSKIVKETSWQMGYTKRT